ncbi:MAG: PhoH family protein [Gammaproteobacteria bacterium]|nr:PhoH family protein [Gammaproteobacteria bacterium]
MVQLTTNLNLEPDHPLRVAALCGPFDQNLKHLEGRLGVHIRNRGNLFQISGPERRVHAAGAVLERLYEETARRSAIEPELVHLLLQESGIETLVARRADQGAGQGEAEATVIRVRRKTVKPRGANQTDYVGRVRSHDVNFGIGPAGTGKTYLAVACAVEALESGRVARLLLVRPAVEAGEKLGFLPGDLAQKIDPYLRPLYDALYEMMGVERVNKAIERNIIEVAPLAYMRGRTLNNAFIILDESQNTTVAQMKMFLTRIGFGATAVITGDITQIDLPPGQQSGLVNVRQVLRDVEGVTFTHFSSKDVVRHPLVKKIVDAYAAHQSEAKDRDGGKDRPRNVR